MSRQGEPRSNWTAEEEDMIRQLYPTIGGTILAKRMGRTKASVCYKARLLGVESDRLVEWTDEMETIIKERYVKDGPTVLSKELGVSRYALIAKSRRMGVGSTRKCPPKGFKWNDRRIKILKDRYESEGGESIAKEFNVALSTVQHKANELGLKTNAGHARWGNERAEKSTSCNIRYFDTWSPNMAYILGFLFADGSINKNLCSFTVCISSRDESILEFIKEEMESNHKIHRKAATYIPRSGGMAQPQSMMTVGSKIVVASLMKLGVNHRKTYKDDPFPDVPKDMLPHFIRGYLDGDGCVSISAKNVCSVSFVGSVRFIQGLFEKLMQEADVSFKVVQVRQGVETEYATVTWTSLRDLRKLRRYIYPKGVGFCLARKRVRLKKWLFARKGQKAK